MLLEFFTFFFIYSTFLKLQPFMTTMRLQEVGASIIALDRRVLQPFYA